jgi:casein kinase I family protein HRR25
MHIGNYKLLEKIGSGNYGDVYKCVHNITNKEYALKIDNNNNELKHIQYETKILKYLNKVPNISKVIYFGNHNDNQYVVLNLFNISMNNYIENFEISFDNKKKICIDLINIMKLIHENGILHRDLKPENILLDDEYELFIIDFGLSKLYKNKYNEIIEPKKYGSLVGSPLYASPYSHELKNLGARDDLISLAYIFIFIFFKNLPWNDNDINLIEKKKTVINSTSKNNILSPIIKILKYLYQLDYKDRPNYSLLKLLINNISETT